MPRENPTCSPNQYLRFERERTIPCRDLVRRIELSSPSSIVDLGCGPGNSTAVILERWPESRITGIDSSPQMLEKARESSVRAEWELADISEWRPEAKYDLVFSNAALQWVTDHRGIVPRLLGLVAEGGAFAAQIPSGTGAWVDAIRELATGTAWRSRFSENVLGLATEGLRFYYDLLSPISARVDVWQTEYVHVLPSPDAVVEWTRGSALRPLLDLLPEEEREPFVSEYAAKIRELYPREPDGKVLFPFLRRFWVAYR